MKRLTRSTLAAAAFTAVLIVAVQAQITAYTYVTGNVWRSLPEGAQMSYVAGFIDAWGLLEGLLQAGDQTRIVVTSQVQSQMQCVRQRQIPLGQMYEVVQKHMRDNPQSWDQPMSILVQISLNQVCPPR